MKHKKIYDRHGQEFFINQEQDINSCIIENAEYIAPDTKEDDRVQHWNQIY